MKGTQELIKLLKETTHQYNNSLTTILGFTQLVMHNEKLDSSLKDYMNIIYESALDGKNIVDRVKELDETKYEGENLRYDVSVNDIIESSIRMASVNCEINPKLREIVFKFTRNLNSDVKINANPREIREVILNILLNAIYELKCNGEVVIETKRLDGEILIVISDNGKGMDKATIEKIFDPYFTTKGDKGTGLGLSISKDIIESNGGRIEVESEENKGTTFKIYF